MNKMTSKPVCQSTPGLTIVIIPAQSGDSEGIFAPKLGDYKNTVVKYLADHKVFLYDKDGNWTEIGETDIPGVTVDTELSLASTNAVQNKAITKGINDVQDYVEGVESNLVDETTDRENADIALGGRIDDEIVDRQNADNTLQGNIDAEVLTRGNADNTLQGNIDAEALARTNADNDIRGLINVPLMNDLVMTADADSVTFTEQKLNPVTGAITTEQDVIPTASTTSAGTISAAEYQSIIDAEELTHAILEGAVAISGISPTATQADLTTAWLNATGYDELINRASIYDIDNSLIWTYYTNAQLWYPATASLTISQFTNSTAGTILGSTTAGNVAANLDGTGTVSGWASLVSDVSGKADASSLSAVATSGLYSDLTGTPTVPTITMQTTDPGEGAPLAADNFIAVYE